ncbi:MAG: cold shock domain-containing protein [Ilumatobacteraceae bacterium]
MTAINQINDDDKLLGTVTNFDEARGLGEIQLDDSAAMFPFHCVSIADGSRTIAVGTKVSFDALLKLGRREAGDIRPA